MGVITMGKATNVMMPNICKGNFNVWGFDDGCVAQYIQNTCKQLQWR